MTYQQLLAKLKTWVSQNVETTLREYWEAWYDEYYSLAENRQLNREFTEFFLNTPFEETKNNYIADVLDDFASRMVSDGDWNSVSSDAEELEDAWDEIREEVEEISAEYGDIGENEKFIAKRIAREYSCPWANDYEFIWGPIVVALDAIGFEEKQLRDFQGTVGQRLILAFYINGNDGQIPWYYAEIACAYYYSAIYNNGI